MKDRFYLECGCGDPFDALIFERVLLEDEGTSTTELWVHYKAFYGNWWKRLKAAWSLFRGGWTKETAAGVFLFGGQTDALAGWLLSGSLEEEVKRYIVSPEQGADIREKVKFWKEAHPDPKEGSL
jgi:hypothetical protein